MTDAVALMPVVPCSAPAAPGRSANSGEPPGAFSDALALAQAGAPEAAPASAADAAPDDAGAQSSSADTVQAAAADLAAMLASLQLPAPAGVELQPKLATAADHGADPRDDEESTGELPLAEVAAAAAVPWPPAADPGPPSNAPAAALPQPPRAVSDPGLAAPADPGSTRLGARGVGKSTPTVADAPGEVRASGASPAGSSPQIAAPQPLPNPLQRPPVQGVADNQRLRPDGRQTLLAEFNPTAQAAPAALPAPAAPAPALYAAPISAAAAPTTFEAPFSAVPGTPDFAPALGAQVSMLVRDGVSQARLHLHPAELGPIAVRIELDGTSARVSMSAEHAPTRQALEQALPTLASALRESGLTLTGGGVFQQPREPQREAPAARASISSARSRAEEASAAAPAPLARVQRGAVDLYA